MLLIAAALLAGAVNDPAAVAQPVAEPTKAAERKICRREGSTSTRLQGKRVCMTRAQWEAQARANGEQLGAQMSRSRSGMGGRN